MTMKKTKAITLIIVSFAVGFTASMLTQVNKERIVSNKVVIEYIDNKDTFDILIKPKKGYNLHNESSMNDTDNYKDAYISGLTKERAQKINYKAQWDK